MKPSLLTLSKFIAASAVVLASGSAFAQTTLIAHPGPANNGGSANWAIFFDLTATSGDFTVTEMTTANSGAAGAAFSVEVFTFVGSGLGGPVGVGPGSSPVGWTSLGVVPATQGGTSSGISLPIDIPDIVLPQGQVTGVAVKFTTVGPRYFGTGSLPHTNYADANLSLTTGDARSSPFTTGGSFFSSRQLVGSVTYVPTTSGGPTIYCTPKVNSLGCTPAIGFSGTPSATAGSGFTVSGSNVRNNKAGILFYGLSGQASTPFQGGTLCVASPVQRTIGTFSGGSALGDDCTGVYSIDMNAFAVGALGGSPDPGLTVPGSVVDCQWYGRDPGFVAPDNTTLTDGLEYTVGP